jgi:hypothetical protein
MSQALGVSPGFFSLRVPAGGGRVPARKRLKIPMRGAESLGRLFKGGRQTEMCVDGSSFRAETQH